MKLVKKESMYILAMNDIQIIFRSFTKDLYIVHLWSGNELSGVLYGDKASDFYRAWRAMQ